MATITTTITTTLTTTIITCTSIITTTNYNRAMSLHTVPRLYDLNQGPVCFLCSADLNS